MKRVIAVLLMVISGLLSFGFGALTGWWAGKLMESRGRDKEWGWIWGSIFSLAAVVVIACLPDRRKAVSA
jgi:hypothetical protein